MCAFWNPRVVWDRCRLQRGEQNWSGCWELSTLLGGGVIETYMTIKTCELKGNAYFIVGKLHLGKNTDRVRKKRTPPEFHSQVCVGMCWEMHSHRAKNDLFWLHREWGRGSSLKTKKKKKKINVCLQTNLAPEPWEIILWVWILHLRQKLYHLLQDWFQTPSKHPSEARERTELWSKLWNSESGWARRQYSWWWTMFQMELKRHVIHSMERAGASEAAHVVRCTPPTPPTWVKPWDICGRGESRLPGVLWSTHWSTDTHSIRKDKRL